MEHNRDKSLDIYFTPVYVKMSTSNAALYGETGRVPLFIDRYVTVIKY